MSDDDFASTMHARGATAASPARAPTAALLAGSMLWGLNWWPLQRFAQAGVGIAALTAVCYAALAAAALPLLWRQRRGCRAQPRRALAIMACGGWANAAFIGALAGGDVTRVMLLFYLAPVWSVIAGRLLLHEPVVRRRLVAVVLALLGALLALGHGAARPFAATDVLALSAGVAFALNNVALRSADALPQGSKNALVFVGALLAGAAASVLLAQPLPAPGLLAPLLVYAFVWLGLANLAVQYGVSHMHAGRAGVLLASELVIAIGSAALLGATVVDARQVLGGVLILIATVLEARAGAES
ncbi:EamA-like transporter family protein [mine drainage metagenome]|uniref:EamA-like transporter family protein n=1 Tax=mine drainage metagenome TaxID=410659 RepID=A0A1J5PZS6_9ZZZZ